MQFILVSRHTNGAEIPEQEREQNLREMGEWIALLKPTLAMPIRGGSTVTADKHGQNHFRGCRDLVLPRRKCSNFTAGQ